jgi:hypothetical protein
MALNAPAREFSFGHPAEAVQTAPRTRSGGLEIQLWAITSLLCTGFALWLGFAWSGYASRCALTPQGWQRGATRALELTLIREDLDNLACASDVAVDALHCAFRANRRAPQVPMAPGAHRAPELLQPYVTVTGELLLAAGLWRSPLMRGALPTIRFTVVCDYHVTGVMKSVALRWSPSGAFEAARQALPVGSLSNCVLPP